MSKEKRVEKEREFRTKVNDFMLLDKKFKKERQVLDRKLTINIQKEIVKLAKEMGKTEGYLLIIEKSVVLYAPNTIDITDKVIQKYNASFAKEAEKK
jgi:outer membrane protein